jgi:hypothetical protein
MAMAILFLAILSYFGLSFYQSARNPFYTVAAERISYAVSAAAQGYIIRDERVVRGVGGELAAAAGEGEKVAVGQLIANVYLGERALSAADEARALRLEIEQIEASLQDSSAPETSAKAYETVSRLSAAVNKRDFEAVEELCATVRGAVFLPSADVGTRDLRAMKERLVELESDGAGITRFYAPVSGVYSSVVDGFEDIGSDSLHLMLNPTALHGMFAAPPEQSAQASVGKLVTGVTWYFAAVMDSDSAANLHVGRELDVSFTSPRRLTRAMRVEDVNAPSGDSQVVILSCKSGISDVVGLRSAHAEITLDSVAGLRVPGQAVRLEDGGQPFVYIHSGGRALAARVEVLGEVDGVYIVRDEGAEGSLLREGAEIIVKANDLFDGKVIRG